jgi:hypothetical protein
MRVARPGFKASDHSMDMDHLSSEETLDSNPEMDVRFINPAFMLLDDDIR